LTDFEANATFARLAELQARPVSGRFDLIHLRAIHRYIFQDVFSWAGELRTVNIAKGGQFFAAAAFIGAALDEMFRQLQTETMNAANFANRAGYYLAEINAIHPFREGNGRTQREFIRELAIGVGVRIDWTRTSREEMIAASRGSFKTGDSSEMVALLRKCLRTAK
jgi:cell filamentation protein